MKLQIIGGGLPAEQAKRLAAAAGWELTEEDADYVLPAPESGELPEGLTGDNVLLDREAWALASSRFRTDAFLRERGFPVPAYFPDGSEPYIVKPDRGGFGRGIWVTDDYCEVGGAVNAGFVAQEELPGDVWSAAVAGVPGSYTAFPPARLSFDGRRQRTGAELAEHPQGDDLRRMAAAVAEAAALRGVLEVEAIFHLGAWKIIDLNARLPILTSDALLDRGMNLLEELVKAYAPID